MSNFDIETIEKKINYSFENKSLLKLAFTHSSYANENKTASNEKLEFLGDSILNFCIAEYLFRKGGGNEGTLSVMRSKIVSEPPLARCVDSLDIIGHLICGIGEERNNPHKSDAVKADLFEAVVGAVYLDSGDISACERLILTHLSSAIADALEGKEPLKYTFRITERKPSKKADAHHHIESAPHTGNSGKAAAEQVKFSKKQQKQEEKLKKQEEKLKKREKKPAEGGLKEVEPPKETKAGAIAQKTAPVPKPAAPARDAKPAKTNKDGKEKRGLFKAIKANKPADYKGVLQNYLQSEKRPKPEYAVTGQAGSAHAPIFNVTVSVDGKIVGSGAGGRKKDAEQTAAHEACISLGLNVPTENEGNN